MNLRNPQTGPEKAEERKMDRKQIKWRPIILCVSVLLILYGAVSLFIYINDLVSSRRTAQELKNSVPTPDITEALASAVVSETGTPVPSVSPSPAPSDIPLADIPAQSDKLPAVEYPNGHNLVSRIQQLRKKSEYIIGWITMDDLDEPVALKDNDFFLNHDAMGKRNGNGAIFMDESTGLLTRPYTIMLYGHNMKTGAMFGNLRKYEKYAYCHKHRILRFDTLYEEGQYVIFAVETISLTPGKKGFVNLTALQSGERALRREALEQLTGHSLHTVLLDVNEEDQLLLLITCVGDDDERLIVGARRIRDGETVENPKLKSPVSLT